MDSPDNQQKAVEFVKNNKRLFVDYVLAQYNGIKKDTRMIEKAILQRTIKKNADGDFSAFMSSKTNSKDIVRVLDYAAKKANEEQRKIMESGKGR